MGLNVSRFWNTIYHVIYEVGGRTAIFTEISSEIWVLHDFVWCIIQWPRNCISTLALKAKSNKSNDIVSTNDLDHEIIILHIVEPSNLKNVAAEWSMDHPIPAHT